MYNQKHSSEPRGHVLRSSAGWWRLLRWFGCCVKPSEATSLSVCSSTKHNYLQLKASIYIITWRQFTDPLCPKGCKIHILQKSLIPPPPNLLHHLADGCFKKSSCRTCVVTFCQGWHLWHIAKCFYFSSHTSMHGLITHENSFQWVTKQLRSGSKINLACTRSHMLLFSVRPDLAHIQHNCQMLLLHLDRSWRIVR